MKLRVLSSTLLLTLGLLTAASAAQSQTVQNRSFSVTKVGHGRPMILIPGLVSSGDVWSSTVEHFKDRYECHVLTLAGFAGQPAVPAPFLQTVRDDVLRYIADQKLDRPVIVGHSLGGFLGLWIAATAPDKVGPVVSVEGLPFFGALGNPAATAEGNRARAEQMKQLFATFTKEQLGAQSRMSLGAMIKDPKQVETAASWAAASDPATAGLAMSEMMTTDLRDAVAAIRTPVLLVGAADSAKDEDSRKQMTALYEAQLAKIPNHQVAMATGARHFVMLDDPAFLFSTMDRFLAAAAH
jgi:pimeloyl-ACP methyl ester carboxylesterase